MFDIKKPKAKLHPVSKLNTKISQVSTFNILWFHRPSALRMILHWEVKRVLASYHLDLPVIFITSVKHQERIWLSKEVFLVELFAIKLECNNVLKDDHRCSSSLSPHFISLGKGSARKASAEECMATLKQAVLDFFEHVLKLAKILN